MYTDVVSESLSLFMYRHEVHVRFSLFIKFLFSPSMLILGLFCLLFSLCLCLSLSVSVYVSLSVSVSVSLSWSPSACRRMTTAPWGSRTTTVSLTTASWAATSPSAARCPSWLRSYASATPPPVQVRPHTRTPPRPALRPPHPPPPTLTQWQFKWLCVMHMAVQNILTNVSNSPCWCLWRQLFQLHCGFLSVEEKGENLTCDYRSRCHVLIVYRIQHSITLLILLPWPVLCTFPLPVSEEL